MDVPRRALVPQNPSLGAGRSDAGCGPKQSCTCTKPNYRVVSAGPAS